MKSIFDKLNLRPQERRLVVGVGIVVFAVVNFWFVIPHFGDLGKLQNKKDYTQKTLQKFKDELAKKTFYEKELKRLESVGAYLPSEEQALELQREVYQQAQQASVMIARSDASRGASLQRTNSFFEDQTLVIFVNTGEKELVDFLWGLGKGQSLTRVSSMTLRRDPSQTKIAGDLTLVKSFQKKPPKAPAPVAVAAANPVRSPSSTTKTAPAVKPATAAKSSTNAPAAAANTNLARRSGPTSPSKK
ncbi:MAG TPA: hypothetical protein VK850_09385 [Candidatus Binatia bacterium]|nr:hypothetical protein [Candidatus Binatia bacterium]